MRIEYNPEYDVLYIKFKKARQVKCVEVTDLVTADVDGRGNLVGLEILDASRQIGRDNWAAVDLTQALGPLPAKI